jgi:hypothetical protein
VATAAGHSPEHKGWVYPKRNVSPFIPRFSKPQRAAINFYGWIALAMLIGGFVLPFVLSSWWWALLVPGGIACWRANRQSMEQFFIENLTTSQAFYDLVRTTEMAQLVKVVVAAAR